MNPLCFRFLLVCFLVWLCPLVGFGQYVQMGSEFVGKQNQNLGWSTAINDDGNVIAISSFHLNSINHGGVQVYEYTNDNWIQKGNNVLGEPITVGSRLRYNVTMDASGTTIAIGTPGNNSNGQNSGHVRVYEWNGNDWLQKGGDINGEAAGDLSGTSLSINASGNILAIGAPENDGNGQNSGHVRVFEWDGTSWLQRGTDIDGKTVDDESGQSVSLSSSGDILAIGAPKNDGNGQNSGHVRVFEWDGTNWLQKGVDIDGETTNDYSGESISINDNGNVIGIGAHSNDGNGQNSGHVRVFEWDGTNWLQKGVDIDGETTNDYSGNVSINGSGNIIAIGSTGSSTPFNQYCGHIRVFEWNGINWIQKGTNIYGEATNDYSGHAVCISGNGETVVSDSWSSDKGGASSGQVRVFRWPNIYGQAYLEFSQNCQKDSLENGFANRQLTINPGNRIVQTNGNGYWGIDSLPIGTYTITTDTNPNNNYQPCNPTYTFTVAHPDSLVEVQPIGYQATQQCTSPSVSINMPFMRPGFSNQRVYIQACNDADATTYLDNAYIVVTLDSLLTIDTASKAYTSLSNNTYQVNVGDLYPGQCANFWLDCTLSQNAILGSSLCMEATLYPIDSCALDSIPNNTLIPCTTPFDFSHLVIEGNCDNNDTISFTITNVEGDMSCWSQVRLYIDGTLVQIDSIQLQSGQSQTFTFPADGRTWRMEVDQHPLHWGNSQPSATIELCGNAANWTPNLVNILPQDDADPVVDIFCGLVTGSYDPNDKTGFPTGIGTTHDILPNQKIEYRIRFQNTGTDTAFTVVVRDTLSTDFNIFSVQSGVSSHDYSFRMYGPRVLEWTFNNIMLPDSNVNEPASNGFVKFEVMQQPNLPNGTVLENSAGIYFDFNAPIITNTSTHTINDGVVILDMTEHISKQMQLKVYPNPTDNVVTVELGKAQEFSVTVLNQLGQVLYSQKAKSNSSQVQLGHLPAGIYYLHIHDGQQTAVQKVVKQ